MSTALTGDTRTERSTLAPRRYATFAVVGFALLMIAVDQTIVATALATLQRDLHAQVSWASWTITVYTLGQIVVMPVAGAIGDRMGRRRTFLVAVAVFTTASLCCGLADNIYELVALRAVQSIGGGAILPVGTAVVSDGFGPDRDRAIGIFASLFPIGSIIGPILGGLIVTYCSWRGIFLVNVPVGLALIAGALAVLPRGGRCDRAPRIDRRGVALLGGGLLCLMYALTCVGNSSPVLRAQVLLPSLVGVASLAGFAAHTRRAAAPFVPLRLLVGRHFGLVNLLNLLFGTAAVGLGALVPLYAEERYGLSTLDAGTLLTARAVGMVLAITAAVALIRRSGYRIPMVFGLLTVTGGLVLLALRPLAGSAYLWLATGSAVTGIGMGAFMPASNNLGLQLEPENTAGIAGLRGMIRQLGGVTSISAITAGIAGSVNPGLVQARAYIILAVIILCAVPIVWLVPDHRGSW